MFIILFWFSLALMVYTYLVFPVIVFLRGWWFPRPVKAGAETPGLSVIIAAYNEQDSIREKIENLQAADYPRDRLQILVASDGSNDQTESIVAALQDDQVTLLALPRRGKAHALNVAIEHARHDVIVFSDANSMFDRNALRELAAPLSDPRVGGVAGDQLYHKSMATSVTDGGERSYWNYDRFLKRWESRGGDVIGATGAIYAIRRECFRPVPEGVTDDFTTSTAVIEQGKRLVFAEKAIAREPVAAKSSDEFHRKTRIITRGFRSLIARRALFNPVRYGFYSLQLVSHKLLRRLMVFPLATLFVSSLVLANNHRFYALTAAAQFGIYFSAALGFLLSRVRLGRSKVFSWPAYFVMVNGACLVAIWRVLCGTRVMLWEPARAAAGGTNTSDRSLASGRLRTGTNRPSSGDVHVGQ